MIFSSEQIRKADAYTIANEPISSIDLMERAAKKCVEEILIFENQNDFPFLIVCGPGNNGGDGLVIARLLHQFNKNVEVVLLGEKFSKDNLINQKRLLDLHIPIRNKLEKIENVIIIDALFGTGLTKSLEGDFLQTVEQINQSKCKVVSIDFPSGLYESANEKSCIVKANLTLTFHCPKLIFFFPEYGSFVGEVKVLDIGLMSEAFESEKPEAVFFNLVLAKDIYKPRQRFSYKNTHGHACLVGGEKGKIGAIELCISACIKSGAGLTTTVIPECGYEIVQQNFPECMVITSSEKEFLSTTKIPFEKFDAIGVGPGMGMEKETANFLKWIIQQTQCELIVDADALNILSENKTWLSFLPAGSILTPHPGEFKRLVGAWKDSFEMIEKLKSFCFRFNCYVVLKGAYTFIGTPGGNLFVNASGNAGLAKGGSGDTLTGIITALKAQNYSSLESALLGVFIHGLAADLAVEKIAKESLLARDVIEKISDAFLILGST